MNTAAVASAPAGEDVRASLGMWVFLASEVLFFGGLIASYAYGRSHWPAGFAAAGHETHVVLGTLNTAVLLTSSALVALAVACDEMRQRQEWVARLLAATCVLGLAFLAIKGYEYRQEWGERLVPGAQFRLQEPGAQLFFVLYFLTTGLHAVHLTLGIGVLAVFAWARHRGRRWAAVPRRLEAAGLYWHFVDVVWIFLYPLLYLAGRNT